jgi:uncharacterized protein YgiM (DUF1202 family)
MRWTPLILGVLLMAALAIMPATASAQATGTATKTTAKKATHSGLSTAAKVTGSADRVLPPMPPDLAPLPPMVTGTDGLPVSPKATSSKAGKAPARTSIADKTGPILPPEAAGKRTFPYTGFISTEVVNVRSGPGSFYYTVAQLKKDDKVTVESEDGGWLAVKPLPSLAGLMHKADLALAADGKTGTVSATGARVYVASPMTKRTWCVMMTLKQGDAVKVQGADGDMVRIAPPEGARVYVMSDFVTAGASTVQTAASTFDWGAVEPPKPDATVDEFMRTDAELQAEIQKPVAQRHYEDLMAKYKELGDKAGKTYLKDEAVKRLTYLGSLRDQQAEYLKVQGLGTKLDQTLAELKARQAAAEATKADQVRGAKPEFLATGVVAKMDSLADVDYPIKFKLVDQNNRPIVVLSSSGYDLNKYIGKVVGVRGTKTFLKDWRIYLIAVDELEVLE